MEHIVVERLKEYRNGDGLESIMAGLAEDGGVGSKGRLGNF